MIFIVLVLVSGSVQAQKEYKPLSSFNGDTIEFLRYNFRENKNRYIGQKFEKLLKDYEKELPIKTCLHNFKRTEKNKPGKIYRVVLGYLDYDQDLIYYRADKPYYYLIIKFSPALELMKNPTADNTELPPFANFIIEEENKHIVAHRMKDAIISDISIYPGLSNKSK